MTVKSSGVLIYRKNDSIEVFLGHMGGPFWAKKDEGAWSIPKGLVEVNEDLLDTAVRECFEEIGLSVEKENLKPLGSVKIKSGKEVFAFSYEYLIGEEIKVTSNMFEMVWPPKSGKVQSFPEVDKGEWFTLDVAKEKITKGQILFLDKLKEMVS